MDTHISSYYKGDARKKLKAQIAEYLKGVNIANDVNLEILVNKINDVLDGFNYAGMDKDTYTQMEKFVMLSRLSFDPVEIKPCNLGSCTYYPDRNIAGTYYDSNFCMNLLYFISALGNFFTSSVPQFRTNEVLFTADAYDRLSEIKQSRLREMSDKAYEKAQEKCEEAFKKDKGRVKKVREVFKSSPCGKTLIEILDKIEEYLQTVNEDYIKYNTRMGQAIVKEKSMSEILDAKKNEDLVRMVNSILDKEFYSKDEVSNRDSLLSLVATAYVNSGYKMPEVHILDNHTRSWLEGMSHTVKFEIIGADGNSYGKISLKDQGLSGDEFNPWD